MTFMSHGKRSAEIAAGYTDSSVRQLYKEKKLWSEIKTNPRHSHLIKELDIGEITTNRAIQIIWEAEHEIVDPKKSITNDSEIPNEVRHTTILYEELEGLLDDLHILENSINPPHNYIAKDNARIHIWRKINTCTYTSREIS